VVFAAQEITRVQSSEPLAAVEQTLSSSKLAVNSALGVSEGQPALVFPYAATGGAYTSRLSLANVLSLAQNVTISYGSATATIRLEGNSSTRISIGDLLNIPAGPMGFGAVRVTASAGPFGSAGPGLVGILDIENATGAATIEARPAATNTLFPHVAHGNGLFTGLALASGANPASVTIEVYDSTGSTPKTATVNLQPNEQRARLISEYVPGVVVQQGGYIRVRSSQPIWAWEIYGSGNAMASGPPL
jgi:hypothetical protein